MVWCWWVMKIISYFTKLVIPCSLPPVKRENIKIFFFKTYFNTIIFFFYERNIFYSYIILLSSYTPSALFLLTIKFFKNIYIQNLFYFLFHIIFTRYLLMIHFLEMMYDTQNDLEFCPLQSYFLFYLFFFSSFFSFCYSNTKLSGFNPKLYCFFLVLFNSIFKIIICILIYMYVF